MLSNYKVLIHNSRIGEWKKIEYLNSNDKVIFYGKKEWYICSRINYLFRKKYEGKVLIYKIDDTKIIIPNYREINFIPFINLYINKREYELNELQLLLYLFSSPYNAKYLEISEYVYIKLQKPLNTYNYNIICKNGNYIFKKDFIDEIIYNNAKLDEFTLYHIYEIIYLNNCSNKYYGNREKISIIINICNFNNINFEIENEFIKIFIIDKGLKYEKEEYFEGEIYNTIYKTPLTPIKIGKYVLLI